MSQTVRDSAVATKWTGRLKEYFKKAAADGHICEEEMVRLGLKISLVDKATEVSDLATALSVNVNRGGVDGDRYVELTTDYRKQKEILKACMDEVA